MSIGIIGIIVAVIALIILKNIISFGLKLACLVIIGLAIAGTVWVCSTQPQMHKPFSLDTIEYLFKINKDGSMTTTKQVTHTIYKEQAR